MTAHTKVTYHYCEYCQLRFAGWGDYQRHKREHKSGDGIAIHLQCDYCRCRFVLEEKRADHVAKFHADKITGGFFGAFDQWRSQQNERTTK